MHFPLFLELKGLRCLVVGGGRIALRKARTLVEHGADVTLVAPAFDPEVSGLGCRTACRVFEDGDIESQSLVVSATDDELINARVSELCRARGVPVNVVDDPAKCTFIFPSIVRKGPLVAAVSSGGACPAATQVVRDRIGDMLTDGFVAAVERLGAERESLKQRFPMPHERACHVRRELESAMQEVSDDK